MLEFSSQTELADMTAGTRVSQHSKGCLGTQPDYPASLVLLPSDSLRGTAVCPRLGTLMENEKHKGSVYLNISLWPLLRGHSFEFRVAMFSEAGVPKKVPTDTRDFGVTVCSLMNRARASLFPHSSCALLVLHHGSTSWEKL